MVLMKKNQKKLLAQEFLLLSLAVFPDFAIKVSREVITFIKKYKKNKNYSDPNGESSGPYFELFS